MIIFMLLLAALVVSLAALVFLVTMPAPIGTTVESFLVAHRLEGDDADVRRAIARSIGRTRDFARRGMVFGLLGAVVLGMAWYQQITVGFGTSPIGDLVTMGLGGWFVGLLLSAQYWRTPSGNGPRMAPLAPRDIDRYRSLGQARAMVAVATSSGLLGVTSLLPGARTEQLAVAVLGLLTVGALGWAAQTQGRIARRPQPFVTAALLAADDALRRTSAQVIGLAGIGVGLVVIGWQASFVARGVAAGSDVGWTWFLPIPPLVAGWVVALRARRLIHPKARVASASLSV